MWTIASMLSWMQDYLKKRNDPNPRISSQWLISDATGLSRTELYISLDRPLSASELDTLRSTVKRRAAGEPLQYITGSAPFRYLDIDVNPGVLIPRPETEVLVSEALSMLPKPEKRRSSEYLDLDIKDTNDISSSDIAYAKDLSDTYDVLNSSLVGIKTDRRTLFVADLCTGTGCVACSLAYEHPDISVIATDISKDACKLAIQNAAKFNLSDRISVLECSFGDGIDINYCGKLDAVVSNPPYIPSDVLKDIPSEVASFEPALALDGGSDGLDAFREIVLWAKDALKIGGALAVELHETTLEIAAEIANMNGFIDVEIVEDLANKPRVLKARKGE